AAFLRVIQALNSLVASLSQDKEQTIIEKEQAATLSLVNDINAALEPLLKRSTSDSQQKTFGTSVKVDEKNAAFVKFSDKHRKLLNAFIRQNPGLLEKSFSVMLKNDISDILDLTFSVDADEEKLILYEKGESLSDNAYALVADIMKKLVAIAPNHCHLFITELAELSSCISKIENFTDTTNSGFQTEHLSYFKFVGRVVGKALFDGQLLDVRFTRSFYKHMLGVKVTYHDIEAIDPGYFKNL
nr:hypothetical protein [Tanacetum cinerariifolium]